MIMSKFEIIIQFIQILVTNLYSKSKCIILMNYHKLIKIFQEGEN